ncbi:MAG TPA: hypothetical protein VIV63_08260 [Steroidobacteraceae bacterium]
MRSLPLIAGAMSLASLLPSNAPAQEISDDWQFAATIYGWFPDIGGDTSLPPGSSSSIDVDINAILDHLKMTAQGSFSIQKGRWGALTDVVYLDVGDSNSRTRNVEIGGVPLPASVTAAMDFDLKSVFLTLGATYRVTASEEATLDVLLGARLASLKPSLEWEFTGNFGPVTPPPLVGSLEESIEQWDAIVGVRGQFAFGADQKWVVPYHLDVGTGDSDLTWQAMVGLAYGFGWGDLGVAWRYLEYDVGSDGPITDINFSGPAIGATFRW